jgi:hypothetical protein
VLRFFNGSHWAAFFGFSGGSHCRPWNFAFNGDSNVTLDAEHFGAGGLAKAAADATVIHFVLHDVPFCYWFMCWLINPLILSMMASTSIPDFLLILKLTVLSFQSL